MEIETLFCIFMVEKNPNNPIQAINNHMIQISEKKE
jgi:hypothetical protein